MNAFVTEEDISNGQVECGLIAQEVLETDISWVVHQQKIQLKPCPCISIYAICI